MATQKRRKARSGPKDKFDINRSVQLVHDKLDEHVTEERQTWKNFQGDLISATTEVKALKDLNVNLSDRAEKLEKSVESLRSEVDVLSKSRTQQTNQLSTQMDEIKVKIDDLSLNGTTLAKSLDNQLNNIRVNGSTMPLASVLNNLYERHMESHKKLDDIAALVAPMQARRTWKVATREMIKRNALMSFIFTTKWGAIVGVVGLGLFVNTILHTAFHMDLDLLEWAKALAGWLLGR